MSWKGFVNTTGLNTDNLFANSLPGTRRQTQNALDNYNATMGRAANQMQENYDKASKGIQEGYGKAKQEYNQNPGVVQSRQELYQRVMGKGGYDENTLNKMKAGSIEQAGVQARDVKNALSDRFGDSQGGGITGENLARALASIGANKANALRDIDVGNAQLAEQQQSEAIPQTLSEAQGQAGLNIGEATANAGLTTEMAKALAELYSAQGGSNLQVGTQKNLLQSIWG